MSDRLLDNLGGDTMRQAQGRGALSRIDQRNARTAHRIEPIDPDDDPPPTVAELGYLESMGWDPESMRRRAIATRILGPPPPR